MWTKRQIENHKQAAEKLGLIKDEFYAYVRENLRILERDGINFIEKAYKKHALVNDDKKQFCIVAFGKNTSDFHYFAKGKGSRLKLNSLIMLDIWARLKKKNTPYADATFMFWYGNKIPNDIQKKWNMLKKARDVAVAYVQKNKLPRGLDVDRAAHDVVGSAGFGSAIKHTIGHSLGFDHPHGKLPGINWREYSRLQKNIGYTIEPGMYFKGKHGMRTEIDFYISKDDEVIITTPIQKDIGIIPPC